MIYLHHGTYYPSLITLLTAIKTAQLEREVTALWLKVYGKDATNLPHFAG